MNWSLACAPWSRWQCQLFTHNLDRIGGVDGFFSIILFPSVLFSFVSIHCVPQYILDYYNLNQMCEMCC